MKALKRKKQKRKKQKIKRLKAGTLQYTLIISIVLALLSGFYILSYYFQGIIIDQELLRSKLSSEVHSAINLFLEEDLTASNEEILPFDDSYAPVTVSRTFWGVYELLSGSIIYGNIEIKKNILIGNKLNTVTNAALFLKDDKKKLSVSGTTRIMGTAYIPSAEISEKSLFGGSYNEEKIISGSVLKSTSQLPKLSEKHCLYISSLRNRNTQETYYTFSDFSDTIIRSFGEPTLHIETDRTTLLSGKVLRGNIIVYADSLIVLDQSTKCSDIMLVAPTIVIKSGFKGSLQAIADHKIILEEHVTCLMPSSLIVLSDEQNNNTKPKTIEIASNTTFIGSIILYEYLNFSKNSRIIMHANSSVYGVIYTSNKIECEGHIFGTLIAGKIYLKSPKGVFENHLHNTVIDVDNRPNSFVPASILDENAPKMLIKTCI